MHTNLCWSNTIMKPNTIIKQRHITISTQLGNIMHKCLPSHPSFRALLDAICSHLHSLSFPLSWIPLVGLTMHRMPENKSHISLVYFIPLSCTGKLAICVDVALINKAANSHLNTCTEISIEHLHRN